MSSITCWCIEASLVILKIKQWSCFWIPRWSFKGWVAIVSSSNWCNLFGWTNWTRFSLGKILVTSYTFLLRITCRRVSPWNWYINFYILFIVFCSLNALKKASKKKEARIKMEAVKVLQQASYRRKRSGWWNFWFWPRICWLE